MTHLTPDAFGLEMTLNLCIENPPPPSTRRYQVLEVLVNKRMTAVCYCLNKESALQVCLHQVFGIDRQVSLHQVLRVVPVARWVAMLYRRCCL